MINNFSPFFVRKMFKEPVHKILIHCHIDWYVIRKAHIKKLQRSTTIRTLLICMLIIISSLSVTVIQYSVYELIKCGNI